MLNQENQKTQLILLLLLFGGDPLKETSSFCFGGGGSPKRDTPTWTPRVSTAVFAGPLLYLPGGETSALALHGPDGHKHQGVRAEAASADPGRRTGRWLFLAGAIGRKRGTVPYKPSLGVSFEGIPRFVPSFND